MAESQDVNTLRRRGRRRVVGAIALVLLAAIILPMVFDPEPKPGAPPVSVRIPGEDDAGFAPKATPKIPPVSQPPAASVALPRLEANAPDKPAAEKPPAEPSAPAKTDAATVQRERAQQALAGGEQFVVPVGAFADPAGVIAQLKAAKLPYFTEPVAVARGQVTRVRAGPFANREAAQSAHDQLKRLGLKPGDVLAKS